MSVLTATTDRVITIKNPYAASIVRGEKTIENRTWDTSYRGRLWVHAGMSVANEAALPIDASLYGEDWDVLPRGVIIGSVELVDVVEDSDSEWAIEGHFHWVLEDAQACYPIPFKGGLGLRHYSPVCL